MASALCRLVLRLSGPGAARSSRPLTGRLGPGAVGAQSRSAVTSSSGAILPKPKKTPFGLARVLAVLLPFLYVGTRISKNFAALLEEHDIFVPEDDDDYYD